MADKRGRARGIKPPYRLVYDRGWAEITGPGFGLLMLDGLAAENYVKHMNRAWKRGWVEAAEHFGFSHTLSNRRRKKPTPPPSKDKKA